MWILVDPGRLKDLSHVSGIQDAHGSFVRIYARSNLSQWVNDEERSCQNAATPRIQACNIRFGTYENFHGALDVHLAGLGRRVVC